MAKDDGDDSLEMGCVVLVRMWMSAAAAAAAVSIVVVVVVGDETFFCKRCIYILFHPFISARARSLEIAMPCRLLSSALVPCTLVPFTAQLEGRDALVCLRPLTAR